MVTEIKYQEWHCSKCNHTWVNRKPGKPVLCPKCKAYKYISPKQ